MPTGLAEFRLGNELRDTARHHRYPNLADFAFPWCHRHKTGLGAEFDTPNEGGNRRRERECTRPGFAQILRLPCPLTNLKMPEK